MWFCCEGGADHENDLGAVEGRFDVGPGVGDRHESSEPPLAVNAPAGCEGGNVVMSMLGCGIHRHPMAVMRPFSRDGEAAVPRSDDSDIHH